MDWLIALVAAWAFERAHFIISYPNYNSIFNGFGAIELTVARQTKAPMAYRVLFPFLVTGIERALGLPARWRIVIYQTLKVAFETLAFWAVAQVWGVGVLLLMVALLLLTIKYDYWDWILELAGVALAMTGSLPLAAAGGVLAGLSRETALLVPIAYTLKTGDGAGGLLLLGVTGGTLLAVRAAVGKRPMYCKRFQGKYNLQLFRGFFLPQPTYHSDVFIALVIGFLVLLAVARLPVGWPIPLAVLVAGWTLAKADETRVFTVCLPWIAAYLLGGL